MKTLNFNFETHKNTKYNLLNITNSDKNKFETVKNQDSTIEINYLTDKKEHLLIGVSIGQYLKSENINIAIDASKFSESNLSDLCEGILIGNWEYEGHKSQKKTSEQSVTIITQNKNAEAIFSKVQNLTNATFLTRSLTEKPANLLTPTMLAEIAKGIPGLKCTVEEMKSGGIWEVGKGSVEPSLLITCEWEGEGGEPIALVGKGVTFDSGGLSLKPPKSMEDMKIDMSGAATVLGILQYAAAQKLPNKIIGIIPCVENMPSANALKPGDVITSLSGQTIEVLNTDAEGRLILADALYVAQEKYGAKTIIDFATLTGAIVVALGELYCGLFSNDDELSTNLTEAGNSVFEPVWRLPLHEKYDQLMDTQIADMCNIQKPGSGAGSITAAQFLQRFINNDVKWAHLDIAGVARTARNSILGIKESTGFGVRLIERFLRDSNKQ